MSCGDAGRPVRQSGVAVGSSDEERRPTLCYGASMKRSPLRLALLAAVLAALAAPPSAVAQDGPVGIGFAQAEEGTWWCRGDNPVTVLGCAQAACFANAPECARTAWCYPARWSGLMTVWFGEFHATQIVCGAPSREALIAALEAFCIADPYAASCDMFLVIDPEGIEEEVLVEFTGGGAGIAP